MKTKKAIAGWTFPGALGDLAESSLLPMEGLP
jgi:hypothetical protein